MTTNSGTSTEVGNYFVSNYPPFSQWKPELVREAVAALDEAFHATLVSAAGNLEMARVHADVIVCNRIVRQLDFPHSPRLSASGTSTRPSWGTFRVA